MSLKMKTCFKFLPLFFCFFFILSAPSCFSCGGSNNVTKQPWERDEEHQDGNKDNKSDDKSNDGNHGGGVGDNINVSTTPVTGDIASGNPTTPNVPKPAGNTPFSIIAGQHLKIVTVEVVGSVASAIAAGTMVMITFVNEDSGLTYTVTMEVLPTSTAAELALKQTSNKVRKICNYNGNPVYGTLHINDALTHCVISFGINNRSLSFWAQGDWHPCVFLLFHIPTVQRTVGCFISGEFYNNMGLSNIQYLT